MQILFSRYFLPYNVPCRKLSTEKTNLRHSKENLAETRTHVLYFSVSEITTISLFILGKIHVHLEHNFFIYKILEKMCIKYVKDMRVTNITGAFVHEASGPLELKTNICTGLRSDNQYSAELYTQRTGHSPMRNQ
jgi:hypothetical protein